MLDRLILSLCFDRIVLAIQAMASEGVILDAIGIVIQQARVFVLLTLRQIHIV